MLIPASVTSSVRILAHSAVPSSARTSATGSGGIRGSVGDGGDGDTFEGARYVGEFGEKCTRLILEKAAAMYPCDGVQG